MTFPRRRPPAIGSPNDFYADRENFLTEKTDETGEICWSRQINYGIINALPAMNWEDENWKTGKTRNGRRKGMELLSEALKEPEVKKLFLEVAQGNCEAKEKLLERLKQVRLPKLSYNRGIYGDYEDDVRQELLMKILQGKVEWDPARGQLSTYVGAILQRLWMDVLRDCQKHKAGYEGEGTEPVSDQGQPAGSCEDLPKLKLKEKRCRELDARSCQERLVVKMWKPYLFGYLLERDENYLLEKKLGLSAQIAIQRVEEAMAKAMEKGKDYISAAEIAEILQMPRNTVDQIISRARKNMPWLGDLRYELE